MQRQPDSARVGDQQQESPYLAPADGEPLGVRIQREKKPGARVRQLEHRLAVREGRIEVFKNAIGRVSNPGKNG